MMKVLVANRSEIACRILRTLRELNLSTVAVYSPVDAQAPHVFLADEAVPISNYLDAQELIRAAKSTGATFLHPGYGFLSQNVEFAELCAKNGIVFMGPSPHAMRILGDKRQSREAALKCGIPVIPGEQTCDSLEQAEKAAQALGFPLLLKAAGGGGGKGMRLVFEKKELKEAFYAAGREAQNAFNDARLLIEKYIYPARHIEVQIMGDGKNVIALGERECSLQRRYQKVIEESPSIAIDEKLRKALCDAAVKLAQSVGYANAGTVEFLVSGNEFYFLEVNTRLQVEHPVTEMRFGCDLVAMQMAIAQGEKVTHFHESARGHAIEARLTAENPYQQFLPSTGEILHVQFPQRPCVRVDAGIEQGSSVTPNYDSLLAKIIAFGQTREEARKRLIEALRETCILGVHTNLSFLITLLESDYFISAQTFTTTLEQQTFNEPNMPEFLKPLLTSSVSVNKTSTTSPFQALSAFRFTGLSRES